MSAPSDLVLHHLAIKGIADVPTLSICSGLDEATVATIAAELIAADLAVERTGRLAGFSLTPAGRDRAAISLETDSLRARKAELAGWYERFEGVNTAFKQLCTSWQLVDDTTVNDHSDAEYDATILEQLAGVHVQATGLLDEADHERLDRYSIRLADAAAAVASGETRRFTAPLCHSYHDVWMELHHDLITSFDLKRTAADA